VRGVFNIVVSFCVLSVGFTAIIIGRKGLFLVGRFMCFFVIIYIYIWYVANVLFCDKVWVVPRSLLFERDFCFEYNRSQYICLVVGSFLAANFFVVVFTLGGVTALCSSANSCGNLTHEQKQNKY